VRYNIIEDVVLCTQGYTYAKKRRDPPLEVAFTRGETYTKIAKSGPGKLRGYENPHDIQWENSANFFRHSCPNTNLIVSLMHPVTWFESFYNYRIIHHEDWSIHGTPNELITPLPGPKPVYITSANGAFHRFLAVLGKTPRGDEEVELLNPAF